MAAAGSALSRLLLPIARAGMAGAKAAGKGTLKGVHNASRNMAKAQAGNFLRRTLKSGSYAGMLAGEGAPVYAREPALMVQHMLPPMQQFPAVCACDVEGRAEQAPGGKKLLTCHSCAPRGMGARNYRAQLEGQAFVFRGRSGFRSSSPRPRAPSASPRSRGASGRGASSRRASSRRASGRAASGRAASGRAASGRAASSSKTRKSGSRNSSGNTSS